MSIEITRIDASDYEEEVDLLNLVFSQASVPHDFASLLPKLYRRDDELMSHNIVCKVDGKIRASVGCSVLDLLICEKHLKTVDVVGVATHKAHTGKGLMKMLMDKAIDDMKLDNVDFSCLGGYRQRYNHYGYEKAGTRYTYHISKRNLKTYPKNELYTFKEIKASDIDFLKYAWELYYSRPFAIDRKNLDEFYLTLKSWNMTPYAALDASLNIKGYICASNDYSAVNEYIACDGDAFLKMIASYLMFFDIDGLSLAFAPWETEYMRQIGTYSEGFNMDFAYNYRIFNWLNVLDATFELKSKICAVADGELVFGIEGDANYCLRAKDGITSVERTTDKADFSADSLLMTRLIFGPLPPHTVAKLPKEKEALINAWFPLPISWYRQDCG